METRKVLNTLADQPCWTIFVNHVTPFTSPRGYFVKTRAKSGISGQRHHSEETFSGFKNGVDGVAKGSHEILHVVSARPIENCPHES